MVNKCVLYMVYLIHGQFDEACMNLRKEVLHTRSKACYLTIKSLCKRNLSILKSNKKVLNLEVGSKM
jgi:hypothetical protein